MDYYERVLKELQQEGFTDDEILSSIIPRRGIFFHLIGDRQRTKRKILVGTDSFGTYPSHEEILAVIECCKKYLSETTEQEIILHNKAKTEGHYKYKTSPPQKGLPPIPGFVYFIIEKGGKTKIGKTRMIKERINQIHYHNIRTDDIDLLELSFHKKYKKFHSNGEWFALSPEILSEIKQQKEIYLHEE